MSVDGVRIAEKVTKAPWVVLLTVLKSLAKLNGLSSILKFSVH